MQSNYSQHDKMTMKDFTGYGPTRGMCSWLWEKSLASASFPLPAFRCHLDSYFNAESVPMSRNAHTHIVSVAH